MARRRISPADVGLAAPAPPGRQSKYGNQRTVGDDGEVYDSKLEARHAKEYRALLRAGELVMYARQVLLYLERGIVMKIDHHLRWADGREQFIDSKGVVTQVWRVRQKLAANRGVVVEVRGK